MPRQVWLGTRDLLFRSKLARVVAAAGAELTRDETACDLAVLEIEPADSTDRIATLVARGTPVLAYGSHVRADLLCAAREAGLGRCRIRRWRNGSGNCSARLTPGRRPGVLTLMDWVTPGHRPGVSRGPSPLG